MRLSLLLPLLQLLLLASCTIDPVRNFGGRPITDGNRGYVLLAVGAATSGPVFRHYNVILREMPDGKPVSVLFTKGSGLITSTPIDLSSEFGAAALFLVPLPSGDYEVSQFRVYPPHALSPEVSLPFKVVPGQITYVGRFTVGVRATVAMSGVGAIRTDGFEEDASLARRKFPEEVATHMIVKASGIENPIQYR